MNEPKQAKSLTKKYVSTDFEIYSSDENCENKTTPQQKWYHNIKYLILGIIFGIVLVKGEVISWFRIQEMFRIESFYMYGVIGTAVVVGIVSVYFIKRFNVKTIQGEKISFPKTRFNKGLIYGGLLFGCGWALTGACPGPIFAQIGSGCLAVIFVLLSAIAGTWMYGVFENRLPH
jgi:uncharacterized membrane protein YedE/YeeE